MVKQRKLHSGQSIPALGLGTFGSDRYDAQTVAQAVKTGLAMGYRLIDCASVYGNEAQIGPILTRAQQRGLPRSDLFIISKVWNDSHAPGAVRASLARTLKDLQLDYLDLYMIHWPLRNFHPLGAAPDYQNPLAGPYRHEQYMETWHQLEMLQQEGLVRQIGTSNMTVSKLQLLLRDCSIRPAANEMELHPSFQQEELFSFCHKNAILPLAFSPLGSPSRPQRDRTDTDLVDFTLPQVRKIAAARQWHPAQACLKWAIQRGQVPLPFTVKPEQLQANFSVLSSCPLSKQEMADLAGAERNNRLIKGQVFLWPGAEGWWEIWDQTKAQSRLTGQ